MQTSLSENILLIKKLNLILQPGPPGFFKDDDDDGQYDTGDNKWKFHPEHEVHRKDRQTALGDDSDHDIEHIQTKTAVWFKGRIFFLNQ